MSHTGSAVCNIVHTNPATLRRALEILCAASGARIKTENRLVKQWAGATLQAKGTILAGLPFAYSGTEVDVWVDEQSKVRIEGDANTNARVQEEVQRAYTAAAQEAAMRAHGARTRLSADIRAGKYAIEFEL
jgi:hypothetical protein